MIWTKYHSKTVECESSGVLSLLESSISIYWLQLDVIYLSPTVAAITPSHIPANHPARATPPSGDMIDSIHANLKWICDHMRWIQFDGTIDLVK